MIEETRGFLSQEDLNAGFHSNRLRQASLRTCLPEWRKLQESDTWFVPWSFDPKVCLDMNPRAKQRWWWVCDEVTWKFPVTINKETNRDRADWNVTDNLVCDRSKVITWMLISYDNMGKNQSSSAIFRFWLHRLVFIQPPERCQVSSCLLSRQC